MIYCALGSVLLLLLIATIVRAILRLRDRSIARGRVLTALARRAGSERWRWERDAKFRRRVADELRPFPKSQGGILGTKPKSPGESTPCDES